MKWIGPLLLLILLVAPPVASQVPDDKLIVPGVRIGKWTLELTIADLVSMNGAQNTGFLWSSAILRASALEPDLQDGITFHIWERQGLIAGTRDGKTLVFLVAVEAPEYRTSGGIGFGSAPGAVEAAFGKLGAVTQWLYGGRAGELLTTWIYDALGVAIVANPGRDSVFSAYVFRPNSARTIWQF